MSTLHVVSILAVGVILAVGLAAMKFRWFDETPSAKRARLRAEMEFEAEMAEDPGTMSSKVPPPESVHTDHWPWRIDVNNPRSPNDRFPWRDLAASRGQTYIPNYKDFVPDPDDAMVEGYRGTHMPPIYRPPTKR